MKCDQDLIWINCYSFFIASINSALEKVNHSDQGSEGILSNNHILTF